MVQVVASKEGSKSYQNFLKITQGQPNTFNLTPDRTRISSKEELTIEEGKNRDSLEETRDHNYGSRASKGKCQRQRMRGLKKRGTKLKLENKEQCDVRGAGLGIPHQQSRTFQEAKVI